MTPAAAPGTALTPARASSPLDTRTPAAPADPSRVEEFLQLLARAARHFHTYPAASQRCIDAVDDCHRALTAVEPESIVCVVTPRELLAGGTPFGRNTLIEHELARRLHDVRCRALEIDRSATRRDISVFCAELVAHADGDAASLHERLRRRGLERITVSEGYRAEVLDIAAQPALSAAVDRAARASSDAQPSTGRVGHLYPPDKGWLRVDPATPLREVTLPGLALLVDDPATLAQMLSRVAGNSAAPLSPGEALEERCEDVARLYTALDPVASSARFARLAAAVLAMEPPRRRRLLAGKVLPALVDGRAEGALLRELPDPDLADALSLLLDVETAAPELLATALDRLNLSSERRDRLAPMLEDRIRAHSQAASGSRQRDSALRERTQQLIRVVNGEATFDGFAAFDLSMDGASEAAIARTGELIRETNLVEAQLGCVSQLLALTADPETAERLLRQASRLLGELERAGEWTVLAQRLTALQQSANARREGRPDVAAAITASIQTFYTPGRFARLLQMYAAGGVEQTIANRLIAAAGPHLLGAVLKGLQEGNALVAKLVAGHAATFGPILSAGLDDLPPTQRVAAIRALGATGPGCEPSLSRQLAHDSDAVVREALLALAAVGSREAAEVVTRYLQRKGSDAALAAEDAVWQFSPPTIRQCLRSLLRNRQFVLDNPELMLRILGRTDRFEPAGLADLLGPLTSLRFRFWSPRLLRVGRRAAALLQR